MWLHVITFVRIYTYVIHFTDLTKQPLAYGPDHGCITRFIFRLYVTCVCRFARTNKGGSWGYLGWFQNGSKTNESQNWDWFKSKPKPSSNLITTRSLLELQQNWSPPCRTIFLYNSNQKDQQPSCIIFLGFSVWKTLPHLPLSPSIFSPATFVAGVSSLNDKNKSYVAQILVEKSKKFWRTFPRRHVAGDSFALTKNVLAKISFVKRGGKFSRSFFPSDMSLGILLFN